MKPTTEIRVASLQFVGRHAARPGETVIQVTTEDGSSLMLSFFLDDVETLAKAIAGHMARVGMSSSEVH